jgi:hypothetical protein
MPRTITISADQALQDALSKRAEVECKSMTEVVRDILETALSEQPLARRIRKLRGNLPFAESAAAWQRTIRERNWRR